MLSKLKTVSCLVRLVGAVLFLSSRLVLCTVDRWCTMRARAVCTYSVMLVPYF
jgi:hypothetical protein